MFETYERREKILKLLTVRRKWTMGELAREFGVSERTIMRDVNYLSLSKPICVDTGRHGGVYLSEYSCLTRPSMSTEETEVLWRILDLFDPESESSDHDDRTLTPSELRTIHEMIAFYGRHEK